MNFLISPTPKDLFCSNKKLKGNFVLLFHCMIGTKAKMDIQPWYLKTSKLALALAIIHSKPADRSSREYTEYLASLVTQKESTWKSKLEALEAEVLQLRQKLLLSRISSGLFKNGM